MTPYITLFGICWIISLIWNKFKKNKKISIILMIIICAIISVFAGYRDLTIGTDVMIYANTIIEFLNKGWNIEYMGIEPAYVQIAKMVVGIGGNTNTLLLFTAIIIDFFILLAGFQRKNEIDLSLFTLTFLNIFFGISLNLMRQSIAISIFIFAYHFIEEKKPIKYFLLIFIAYLFHRSAIILFFIYPLYWLIMKNYGKKGKFIEMVTILLTMCILLFMSNILILLNNIGIVPDRIVNYYSYENYYTLKMNWTSNFVNIGMLVLCNLIFLVDKERKKENSFLTYLTIIGIILFQLGNVIPFAGRIAYYFYFLIYLYAIPRATYVLKNRNEIYFFLIVLLFLYFYITFVYLCISEIMPYSSSVLNIK